MGWPLVERRTRNSPTPAPGGIERRRLSTHLRDVVSPLEAVPLAPFRVAALAAAVIRGMSGFRRSDLILVAATLIVAVYTISVVWRPLPNLRGQARTQLLVGIEVVLISGAVLATGGWSSPLALCLIPTAILAVMATETTFAATAIAGSAFVISVQHVVRSPTSDAPQTSVLWSGLLALVAVVAGLARKANVENAGRQLATLDQMGQLSEANALLSSLHRVAQALPASLDLDDVLDSTIERIRQLIQHDMLTILLVNEATGSLEPARAYGYAAQDALRDPLLCPPLAEVLQDPSTLRRDYLVSKHGTARLSVSPAGKSGIYASLRARGVIVGIIAIESFEARHFSQQHTQMLHGLAEPLGIAIDNARLFRKLRVVGADEERNRIARDLHDRIGSSLASLGFALDGTLSAARKGQPVADDLHEIRAYVTGMIGEVREALYDLRSDVNDTQDLAATLRQFAERVKNRSGLAIRFQSDQQFRLPILQEREIWHIAREALINVERHARATTVDINWICTPIVVRLTILDNGIGIGAGTPRADSFGMVGMRERAESIDALFTADTSPGGTAIRVELRRPTGA